MDLDAARRARATERGDKEGTLEPVTLGGRELCKLPAEFPIDVLEPLTGIDFDSALFVRRMVDAWRQDPDKRGMAIVELVLDLLITNPELPGALLAAIKEMGRRLLTPEGYQGFVAARPSPEDVAALIGGLAGKYAFSLGSIEEGEALGESQSSSSSLSDGTTSTPTSPTTTADSTSTGSGGTPESPASSDSTPS